MRPTSPNLSTSILTKWLPVPLLAAAFVAGCYPKAGPAPGAMAPTSVEWAAAKWPGDTEASRKEGHGCHGYPDLVAISEEDWPSIAKRMASKSDLPPEKGELLVHYVLTARHEQAAAAPTGGDAPPAK
jgi:hypothetical protein